ncbi:MAG: hypothetical protein EOM67_15160 [Spirochaetia bacterium]|nr:hypothetical protein [Spirochaetia bacterium]
MRNYNALSKEKVVKQELEQVENPWEKQNSYIAVLNWTRKLGVEVDTSLIWALVRDEEMLSMLKRPYWKKDEITCTYLMYYLIEGEFPECHITKDYLLRK